MARVTCIPHFSARNEFGLHYYASSVANEKKRLYVLGGETTVSAEIAEFSPPLSRFFPLLCIEINGEVPSINETIAKLTRTQASFPSVKGCRKIAGRSAVYQWKVIHDRRAGLTVEINVGTVINPRLPETHVRVILGIP